MACAVGMYEDTSVVVLRHLGLVLSLLLLVVLDAAAAAAMTVAGGWRVDGTNAMLAAVAEASPPASYALYQQAMGACVCIAMGWVVVHGCPL